MARVAIAITVVKPDSTNGDALIPAPGASVTVRKRADNSLATVYTTETGGTTTANPLSTDTNGRVTGWVDRGAYKLTISGTGITTYDELFDAAPGADNTVDAPWLGSGVLPLGAMMPYAGSGDPAGGSWLVCDGRALSRTTYAGLFAAVGTAFGAGDGSTTFNVPDLRGRHPLGAGQGGGLTNRTRGATGGEESHTLASGEMPSHSHDVNPSNYDGIVSKAPAGQGVAVSLGASSWELQYSRNTSLNGGGQSHNNMPPFVAVNFIIRAL